MKRVPEPELMDSEAQTVAYAEADFNESNALFAERFLENFPGLSGYGCMIDLGCGPGDIAVRMAKAWPGWSVTAVDAGENMLRRARERIATEPVGDRIHLRHSYLPDDSLEEGGWDAVISNSLLHHLPDPGTLWDSVRRVGVPGAAVQVMDLSRPDSEAQAHRLVNQYTDGAPDILREDFHNSLLAAYTPGEVMAQLEQAGIGHLSVAMVSDRHWMASGFLPD
jgi:ubiquinone/menaquinone biosynthesis C-methylase UbiE